MIDSAVIQATLERAVITLINLDSFRLKRLPTAKAVTRVRRRLQEEMIDAKYDSPYRADTLGVECRNLANVIEGLPGPVIMEMMNSTISLHLPLRTI